MVQPWLARVVHTLPQIMPSHMLSLWAVVHLLLLTAGLPEWQSLAPLLTGRQDMWLRLGSSLALGMRA